jgi:RimJ/RimL family protein N-acetyltransferase
MAAFELPLKFALSDGREAIIRLASVSDAATYLEFLPQRFAETDFLSFMPGEFNISLKQEEDFIRQRLENPHMILLVVEADGTMIACGGAEPTFPHKRHAHHAELGMAIAADCWSMGIGRKLLNTLVAWAEHAGLHKINLRVYADNERAVALYRSAGFVEEGRLKDDRVRADGTFGDTLWMSRFLKP